MSVFIQVLSKGEVDFNTLYGGISTENKVNPSYCGCVSELQCSFLKSLIDCVLTKWFLSICNLLSLKLFFFLTNVGFRWLLGIFREFHETVLLTDVTIKPEVSAQRSLNKACFNHFVSKIACKTLHLFKCHDTACNMDICCNTSVQFYAARRLRLGSMCHTEHHLFLDRKIFQVMENEVRSNVWIH